MTTNNNVNIISASLGTVFVDSVCVFNSIHELSAFIFRYVVFNIFRF